MTDLPPRVECYSGSQYPERPAAVWWQGVRLEVTGIHSEARLPEGKRFLVETSGEKIFELIYRLASDDWVVHEMR